MKNSRIFQIGLLRLSSVSCDVDFVYTDSDSDLADHLEANLDGVRDKIKEHNPKFSGVFDISSNPIPDTVSAVVPYKGQKYLECIMQSRSENTFTFDEIIGVNATGHLSNFRPGAHEGYLSQMIGDPQTDTTMVLSTNGWDLQQKITSLSNPLIGLTDIPYQSKQIVSDFLNENQH